MGLEFELILSNKIKSFLQITMDYLKYPKKLEILCK